jgi:hypothetical protein
VAAKRAEEDAAKQASIEEEQTRILAEAAEKQQEVSISSVIDYLSSIEYE